MISRTCTFSQAKGRGKWTPWLDLIKDQTIDPNVKKLSDIIVPTMDTSRLKRLYLSLSLNIYDSTIIPYYV